MSQIAIVNVSTGVTDTDGQFIVDALNGVLPLFCGHWSLAKYTAVYVGKTAPTTTIPLKVFLMDNADIPNALGYHSLSNDVPYGKCFIKPLLKSGGVTLYSTNPKIQTFAQVVAHEVFELLVDPLCNTWWDIGDGKTLLAAETCDPVQGNVVLVNVIKNSKTTSVGMSDWILPSWTDPQRKTGPFNYMNTLKKPFSIDKGGYAIKMIGGGQGYVTGMMFGDGVSEAQRQLCESELTTSKRFKKTT